MRKFVNQQELEVRLVHSYHHIFKVLVIQETSAKKKVKQVIHL